jgi:dihydroorotate dehydrogenase electron transfer subunit
MWTTTEDGSMGEQGRVTDVIGEALARTDARVVYACGPNAMLRAVAELCSRERVACQVAVEEMMACGLGVCWTCVVPMISADGRGWWNVRACVEGPVFNGARVWWDRWLGEPETPAPPAEEVPVAEAEAVEAGPRW